MTRSVDTDRLAAAGQIMLLLRRSSSFREIVSAHESGERPILIALVDDALQEVVERIHDIGLPVALVVQGPASLTVMTVNAREAESDVVWEPAPADATIGTVLSRFGKRPFGVPDPVAKRELILKRVEVGV
jgi:hypothetical protein